MRARKRFGQHFLEPAWADKVVNCIGAAPDDVFLEIGPGPGILTLRLAPLVSHLFAIEIDRDLVRDLAPRVPGNVTLISGDALDADLSAVLAVGTGTRPVRVAGNLPYNISSPILFRLLDLASERPVLDATLMLQREVGDRILAKPGTAEYGVLSVLIQWRADVSRLLAIPPGAFRPAPDVRSALVRLRFRPPTVATRDAALFERMVREMFTQRRKTLANALAVFAGDLGVEAAQLLRSAGVDPRRRAETLEIVEIARLADAFSAARK